MHVQPLVPLRRTVMVPLASMSATVAWAVTDAGPADNARAIFWSLVSPAAEAAATVMATETAASAAMRDGMVPPQKRSYNPLTGAFDSVRPELPLAISPRTFRPCIGRGLDESQFLVRGRPIYRDAPVAQQDRASH